MESRGVQCGNEGSEFRPVPGLSAFLAEACPRRRCRSQISGGLQVPRLQSQPHPPTRVLFDELRLAQARCQAMHAQHMLNLFFVSPSLISRYSHCQSQILVWLYCSCMLTRTHGTRAHTHTHAHAYIRTHLICFLFALLGCFTENVYASYSIHINEQSSTSAESDFMFTQASIC